LGKETDMDHLSLIHNYSNSSHSMRNNMAAKEALRQAFGVERVRGSMHHPPSFWN